MKNWNDDMESAPMDEQIEGLHSGGDVSLMFWSERPVCMGGPTVQFDPGWATCGDTDYNLPLDGDDIVAWRHPSQPPARKTA